MNEIMSYFYVVKEMCHIIVQINRAKAIVQIYKLAILLKGDLDTVNFSIFLENVRIAT